MATSTKWKSRKFWISILGAIIGAAGAVSGIGGKAGAIAGIIVAVGSCITYVITEGKIDATSAASTSVKSTVETVMDEISEIKSEGTE